MYEILRAGGFTTGGFNFDAKLRRQSIDRADLFHAHIGGIDTLARALLVAADMVEDGDLADEKERRYAGWAEGLGAEMLDGRPVARRASRARVAGDGHRSAAALRRPGAPREPRQPARSGQPIGTADAVGSHVLGIDVSTTATKAILVDEAGRGGGRRHRPSTTTRCRGRCGASRTRSCGGTAPRPRSARRWRAPASPAATSPRSGSPARCTGPCCSTTPTGRCGRRSCGTTSGPRPSATRSASWSGATRLIEITGNDALTGFTAPKLLWVRQHEPESGHASRTSCCRRTTSASG